MIKEKLKSLIKPFCVLLACIILFSAFVAAVARINKLSTISEGNYDYNWEKSDTHSESEMGYILSNEDETSALYVNYKSGSFYLENKIDGTKWYSTPQDTERDDITGGITRKEIQSEIVLEYINVQDENSNSVLQRTNSLVGCANGENISVENIKNGVKVTYDFKEQEIRIRVNYTLNKGIFEAKVLLDELEDGTKSYLVSLSLLPYFGAAGLEEKGYLFIPDGCGAIANFNNGVNPLQDYEKAVYGDDRVYYENKETAISENIIVPVFGTVYENRSALMGIITEGDGGAKIVSKIGSSQNYYNTVYSKMMYRIYSQGESLYTNNKTNLISTITHTDFGTEAYTVRYYMLSGEKADYSGFAREYRNYLINEKGLESNPMKPALAVDIYGLIKQKTTNFGVTYNKSCKLTTFDESREILNELKESGIDRFAVRYIGWNNNGVYNLKITDKANPLSNLGGKESFISFSKYISDSGSEFYPVADLVTFVKSGNGLSVRNDSAKSVNGDRGLQYAYSPVSFEKLTDVTPWNLIKPSLLSSVSKEFLNSYKYLEIDAISLSEIGDYAYSDFTKNGGIYKAKSIEYIEHMLQLVKKENFTVAVSGGNAYTIPYTSRIFDLPISSSGYDIFDYDVPFVQMVLHSYIPYTTLYMKQSTDMKVTTLKAVETGSDLLFSCVSDTTYNLSDTNLSNLFSSEFSLWKDDAIKYYNKYKSVAELVWDSEIIAHSCIKDDLFKVTYSNGTVVYVNYSNEKKTTDGISVEALDFTLGEAVK